MKGSLQPLNASDRDLIRPWRNALEVRRQMYSQHEITPEEHHAWFERMQTDPRVRWYLYRDASGEPAGVAYFTHIDAAQQTAFWGFYTRPQAPRGTGTRILYAAVEQGFSELGLVKLSGEALATNTASVHLHKKCGFIEEGRFREQFYDGEQRVDIVRLGMLAREWPEHRERLREHIEELDAVAGGQDRKDILAPRGDRDPLD